MKYVFSNTDLVYYIFINNITFIGGIFIFSKDTYSNSGVVWAQQYLSWKVNNYRNQSKKWF